MKERSIGFLVVISYVFTLHLSSVGHIFSLRGPTLKPLYAAYHRYLLGGVNLSFSLSISLSIISR